MKLAGTLNRWHIWSPKQNLRAWLKGKDARVACKICAKSLTRSKIMNNIYLDNAATTKPLPEVVSAVKDAMEKYWGNPSSIYTIGSEARSVVDKGREAVSNFLGCEPEEIIFTSGGSESDNLAIRGMIEQFTSKPHVVTTAFEHHAVLHTVQALEKAGRIEATYLKPDKNGLIDPKNVESAIKANTVLVSIMYVNNETGVAQDIAKIGEAIKRADHKVYFHTDAVQAAEYFDLNPDNLNVDLLSLSAHKFHGPRGVGILYIRKNTPIIPQITGGSQELNKRAGTENTPAIAGLAAATTEIKSKNEKIKIVEQLRNKLEQELTAKISNSIINGKSAPRAPHISNISFINAEGEAIILNLDMEGIAVSSGSACTSGSLDPSHVLTSMGVPPEQAHGSIRFSLSNETSEEEIDRVIEVLPPIIEKLRAMSPIKTNNEFSRIDE